MLFEVVAIQRAKQDIEAGRLWKARDRLGGYLQSFPADQVALDLLGEVYFRMGDYPAAGRFWFLTERTGPDVDIAMAALVEHYPNQESLAAAIPVRAPVGAFPKSVQLRVVDKGLLDLVHPQAREPYEPQRGPYERFRVDPLRPSWAGRFGDALGRATLRVVGVGGWIVGAVYLWQISEGWVLAPVIVAFAIALLAEKVDFNRRKRRLEQLRDDLEASKGKAAETPRSEKG